MRHRLLVPSLLLAATACSYPRFAATRTVDYEIPPTGVQKVDCETHNGGITIVGDVAAAAISLRAEITARAGSQADADALLQELDVRRDVADGQLTVAGTGPRNEWSQHSSFAFTLTVPPAVAVTLTSHNGTVRITGVEGSVAVETHNGSVVAEVATGDVRAVTHNGDVRLSLAADARAVTLETHNGDVTLELADATGAEVTAETHNGRIRRGERVVVVSEGRGSFRGRVGDGDGTVEVTTHNGDITLR